MSNSAVLDEREVICFTNQPVKIPDSLQLLRDGEAVPKKRVCWRIMTKRDGDKRVVWDARSIPEINDAKKLFDQLKAEGMTPFVVGTDGSATSREMEEFDPLAEEVLFVPMKHVIGG